MKEPVPGRTATFLAESTLISKRVYEKKIDLLARTNSSYACSDRLDSVDPAGGAKIYIWRKIY